MRKEPFLMAKFNVRDTRSATFSPVTSTSPALNHEGGSGYARDAKSELFLLAVANMVGEQTFYEQGKQRDDRYAALVREVAVVDPQWTGEFLGWLRSEGNMRSASLVGAAEATRALLAAKLPGGRQMVASVLQRADEPGELLAYWTSAYGRAIPKPVKRGVADAVQRLYTEYALLKYDTASKGYRFGDVLDLTHPEPKAPWQGDLFTHALDRRHGRGDEIPEALHMVQLNQGLRDGGNDPMRMLDPDVIRQAGLTWEDVLSLLGSKVDKAQLWQALIPTMGYMALLRNLRNFDDAGVGDTIAATVAERLADPERVAKSRQFPFRFYAAHKAVGSLRWGHAVEKALAASLANVPALAGRTLVLVDQSPSMWPGYGMKQQHRDIINADLAKLFGSAVALRADNATLVQYGGTSVEVPFRKGDAVLRVMERFQQVNATDTFGAIKRHFAGHDRVVIVTDEQNQQSAYGRTIDDVLPTNVPAYVWNIGGYEVGSMASGANRHTFAGLTDAAFRMVPLLEGRANGRWPWQDRG
jgi:hypothetical protein